MSEHTFEVRSQKQLVAPSAQVARVPVSLVKQPSPLQHSVPPAVQLWDTPWQVDAGAEQTPFRHWLLVSQHGTVPEQLWSSAAQVPGPPAPDDSHVPLVAPSGMEQA